MRTIVYRDESGDWRGTPKSLNGRIIAESGEAYEDNRVPCECGRLYIWAIRSSFAIFAAVSAHLTNQGNVAR
jgi:hypothetical protein